MSWVPWLVGLSEGVLLPKAKGCYRRLSCRSDSFCFVSCLFRRRSCLRAVWFLCVPSSDGRCMALSSGVPWLREDTWQPCPKKEGMAMPPAVPSPTGEDKPCPQEPCSEQETAHPALGLTYPSVS